MCARNALLINVCLRENAYLKYVVTLYSTLDSTFHTDTEAATYGCRIRAPASRSASMPEPDPTPQLQADAESAAHAGDLRVRLQAPGRAAHAIPIWDELRTWDPGEG
jgi:hypothetical protein